MEELLNLLKEKNETIGSIESLTGGLFASEIASIPRASQVYRGSLVTYSASLKEKLLHINKEDIAKYGVVSKEIASLMAKNGKEVLGVDLAISFTGNAGPTVEPGGQKVGRVYIGLAYHNELEVHELDLKGSRNEIRQLSKDKGIELAIKLIKKMK